MADHIYIIDGGYFYKTAPPIALPIPTNLFGEALQDSPRLAAQLHGIFIEKESKKGQFQILLKITGSLKISDDVLGVHEFRDLESFIRIVVTPQIYQYPFQPGRKYLISTTQITTL